MKVTFAYTGQLAAAAGTPEQSLDFDKGTPLDAALASLVEAHGGKFAELLVDASGNPRSTLLVALDGEQVSESYDSVVLEDGASLMLMTPIAGG